MASGPVYYGGPSGGVAVKPAAPSKGNKVKGPQGPRVPRGPSLPKANGRNQPGSNRNVPKVKAQAPKAPKATAPKVQASTDPLLDPTQVLSGKSLDTAAQGIADAQTVGPISELAKQIAQNNQTSSGQQQQDFGYYMNLAQAAQNAVTQSQQTATGLNSQLQSIGQGTQGQLAQIGQEQSGGVNGRMAALGLGGDTQAGIKATTAQQQGVGALQSDAARNFGAQVGSSNVQQSIANSASTGQMGQERLANVAMAGAKANEPLEAKVASLDASRGSLKATALGQLRTAERNYMIAQEGLANTAANDTAKNNLTSAQDTATNQLKALGLQVSSQNNKRTTGTSAANNARTTGTSQANNQRTTGTSAANNQRNNQTRLVTANGGNGPGGTKPLTTNEQNTKYQKLSEVLNAIPTLQKNGLKNSKGQVITAHPSEQQIRSLLGTTYDGTLIDAAYELLGWGHITPGTAKAMRGEGLRGGTFRGAPIKVGPAPVSKPGGILGGIVGAA